VLHELSRYALLFFSTLIVGILFSYFLIKNYKILNLSNISDSDFNKPQAFHRKSVPRIGGILFYITFSIIIFFFAKKFYYDLFFLITACFIVGFVDDIKLINSPKLRLIFLLFSINLIIYHFGIETPKFQILSLDEIISTNSWLRIFLLSICFLFIINGSNFIDGFNGLLLGQFSIILIIVNIINFYYYNEELLFLGVCSLSLSLSLLLFNFPKAKLFLGDSGSFIIGATLSYLLIKTSISTKLIIPPFLYACIIYYIFFEVIFSFFRKLIIEKKSPIYPDSAHLHMLFFRLLSKKHNQVSANYKTGLCINLMYILSIIPLMFFFNNLSLVKLYFFFLIILYIFFYFFLYYLNLYNPEN
jgi:UDP-N-acetylmuramyl pentapeptide phosphotransferase/UDP-N-acetylglucosamine-1-phosphate transferase